MPAAALNMIPPPHLLISSSCSAAVLPHCPQCIQRTGYRPFSRLAMVTTRRRARQDASRNPDAAAPSETLPNPHDAKEAPRKVPWYFWTAPEDNFRLQPDDDADVPTPFVFYAWVAAVIAFLLWSVVAGKPPWPPVTYEC